MGAKFYGSARSNDNEQQEGGGAKYGVLLRQLTSQGWTVVSEGSSGAQLAGPKKMRKLDKGAIIVGIPLVLLYGLGLFLIGIALLDYVFLTPRSSHFLDRTNPRRPPLS